MKMKKILFPTDFSHNGDAALEFATALARDMGAKLLIVHVEEPPTAYGAGEFYYGVPEPAHDELRRMLEQVVPPDPMVTSTTCWLATRRPRSSIWRPNRESSSS